jgi:hypothetical protein
MRIKTLGALFFTFTRIKAEYSLYKRSIIYLLSLCNRLGYERPIPHSFFLNRYQHPFGHTSRASEIILTGPLYRLVTEGEPAPGQNPPVTPPPGVISSSYSSPPWLGHEPELLFTHRLKLGFVHPPRLPGEVVPMFA